MLEIEKSMNVNVLSRCTLAIFKMYSHKVTNMFTFAIIFMTLVTTNSMNGMRKVKLGHCQTQFIIGHIAPPGHGRLNQNR